MTLDEAITLLKFNNKHIADLKNDDLQQIAEWLEDYKRLAKETEQDIYERAYKDGLDKGLSDGHFFGYNKAIDDFAETCKQDIICQTFGLTPINIDKIAEQLKDGEGE